TYEVKVAGLPSKEKLEKLETGVKLEWGTTLPAKVKVLKQTDNNTWLQINLIEGKNRQIRKMVEKLGYSVIKLRRVAIGPFKLGSLKPGEYRKVPLKR
ncbi:MAG: pseudouridine synthase, partial [Deltaproteobacteria bacterium]|nr:pseudouridine synthase [Deltaproteobacteria bacterium]